MKTESIFKGKMISLRVDTVEMEGQRYTKREIVNHPPSVCVVAIDDDEQLVLVKQFRKPVEKKLYELPAGIIDIGEEPYNAAIRELSEETGCIAQECEYLTEFYSSPGFTDEKIYIFYAKNFQQKDQNLDEFEEIQVERVPLSKAIKMIEVGDIVDGKTILGILLYAQLRSKK